MPHAEWSRRGLLTAVVAGGLSWPRARTALATPGARAPVFSLPAVRGAKYRGTFNLAEHTGKRPVLLSFFATWCRPCEVELPFLQDLHKKHASKGLVVAAISIDGPETAAQIGPLSLRLGLTYPVLHDKDSRITARYNPRRFVPLLVSIDRKGVIAREHEGWNAERARQLAAEVDALLRAPA